MVVKKSSWLISDSCKSLIRTPVIDDEEKEVKKKKTILLYTGTEYGSGYFTDEFP